MLAIVQYRCINYTFEPSDASILGTFSLLLYVMLMLGIQNFIFSSVFFFYYGELEMF